MFQHFAIFKFFQSRKYQHNEDDFQFKFKLSFSFSKMSFIIFFYLLIITNITV